MGFKEGALDRRFDGDRVGVVVGMLEGILDRRIDDAPNDGLQVGSTVGAPVDRLQVGTTVGAPVDRLKVGNTVGTAVDGLQVGTTVGDRLKACTDEGSSQMGVDPGCTLCID